MRAFFVVTALLVSVAAAGAEDITLNLDPAHTIVQFTLGATLHTVHGTFKLKSGILHFDPATGKIGGEIIVDAASGDSQEAARDRKMHKEVLESARFPEIVFRPDNVDGIVAAQGKSSIKVHGTLSMHGRPHEITLPVEVEMAAGHWTAATHFTVPYVAWGMRNPSTLLLRVSDKVEITAAITQ